LLLLVFLLLIPVSAKAQNAAITINVDANANRRAINPNIYAVAHATTAQLSISRAGCNSSSAAGA